MTDCRASRTFAVSLIRSLRSRKYVKFSFHSEQLENGLTVRPTGGFIIDRLHRDLTMLFLVSRHPRGAMVMQNIYIVLDTV